MEFHEYLKGILTLAVTFTACGGTPTEFSLDLEMTTPVTDVYIGERHEFKLSALFTAQDSPETVIEIISSVTPTVFAIESVNKAVIYEGAHLSVTKSDWKDNIGIEAAMDNTDLGIEYNSRVVCDLGTVTNTDAAGGNELSTVIIYFNAVLVSLGDLSDGDDAHLSGGLDHLSGSRITIVSMPIKVHEAKALGVQPLFGLNPPANIELMTPLKLTLNAKLVYPSSDVKVSVSSLSDAPDDVFIQQIQLKSVGSGFSYSVPNPSVITKKAYDSCPLSNNLELSIGPLINCVSQLPGASPGDDANNAEVEVTVQTTKREIVGETIGVAMAVMINNAEVYVTNFNLTLIAQSLSPVDPIFNLESPTASIVSPGHPATAQVTIETPPTSNLNYTIKVTTKKNSAAANKLSVLALNPLENGYGANLQCPIHSSNIGANIVSTGNNGIMDEGTFTFNISNLGFNSTETNRDRLTLEVSVMMAADAVEHDTHDLTIEVDGVAQTDSETFTVGAPAPYPESVNFKMSANETCTDNTYQSGTTITIHITVVTERSKINGPIIIETPIPANLTQAQVAYVSISIPRKGQNVGCLQLGKLTANMSSWNETSGDNDRGVVTLPLICNTAAVDDEAEDEFLLEVKLRIKDVYELLSLGSNPTIPLGFGMKYSATQIWTVTIYIDMHIITDFGETKKISEIKIENQYMPGGLPPNTVLQWSPDGLIFRDVSLADATVTQGATHWTVKLKRPVVTRYVRIINRDGMCMNTVDYQETTDTPPMYGSVGKREPLAQKFYNVLDDDSSTCMDLPFKTTSDSTPFLWVELPKTIFSLTDTNEFNVKLTGKGIQCNSTTGQVTYVVFPKAASPSPFQGEKKICKLTTENLVESTKTECNYNCACSGADQCSKVSLVMFNSGSGDYNLCDITVTDA